MNHIEKIKQRVKRALQLGTLGLSFVALTACGGMSAPEAELETQSPTRYDYSMSVEVTPQDSQADIEQRYGGSAVVWRPEAGFAVLGIQGGELTTLSVGAEANLDSFSIPSVSAQGYNSWAGGYNSWAGGYNSWAGGYNSWAGGTDQPPTTFEENLKTWKRIRLAEGQALAPKLGKGVKVAVIDTGVDVHHPALRGKLAPTNEWKDFVDGDSLPLDAYNATSDADNAGYGHGTGVAGVILQVAPEATILPIRVLKSNGKGDTTDIAAAIDWAVKQGADVINLSLGTYVDADSIQDMMTYGASHNVYFVASSGNTGDERITYPARLAKDDWGPLGKLSYFSVSVGSIDEHGRKSPFSTYGRELEIVAPGQEVYTLLPNHGVTHRTGTSFAAPMAAGALALALGELGGSSFDHTPRLTVALRFSSDRTLHQADGAYEGLLGTGRLNLKIFMTKVLGIKGEL